MNRRHNRHPPFAFPTRTALLALVIIGGAWLLLSGFARWLEGLQAQVSP